MADQHAYLSRQQKQHHPKLDRKETVAFNIVTFNTNKLNLISILPFLYLHQMAGNTIGKVFCLTTFGESHGPAIGGVIDGCPPGLLIDYELIARDLNRRKPGQSSVTTSRMETEQSEILSGIFEGKTTGAPLAFIIRNLDYRPADYENLKDVYRPSHADYTYEAKYGMRDYRGGGRSSARETAARVFAGSIAKQLLTRYNITIQAYVSAIGELKMAEDAVINFSPEENIVRCPDPELAKQMIQLLEDLKSKGETTGGIITCRVQNTPAGWGEPVFDKLHADLGKAMLSINATKGFEYGSGFKGASMKGSEHNDTFEKSSENKIRTNTNHSGGIQGGISNGMEIYFRTAFKPVSTIMMEQKSVNTKGEDVLVTAAGRHDPCVVPRAVPIVEAMTALVLADHMLRSRTLQVNSDR
jgi:chorismate synthase